MIGSLVRFFYNEVPNNICVIVRNYGKEFCETCMGESDPEYEDDVLFLIYDLNSREYFYAMLNELSFVY